MNSISTQARHVSSRLRYVHTINTHHIDTARSTLYVHTALVHCFASASSTASSKLIRYSPCFDFIYFVYLLASDTLFATNFHAFDSDFSLSLSLAMTDLSNLRTASLYINNQLLSRGLLRDGRAIDFADPAGKKKQKDGGEDDDQKDDKADSTADTMSRVISVVNDLILRRDVCSLVFPQFR